jgi:hypothetical protein
VGVEGPKRWRYYVSQAALQGDRSKAGSIIRVRAADVEALVAEALAKVTSNGAASQSDIRNLIDLVAIGRTTIEIQLSEVAEAEAGARTLTLPLSQARDHPGRKRCRDERAPDPRQRARECG